MPTPPRFEDFALNKQLLTAAAEAGFEAPTPVQQRAIPLALNGHDVLGIAPTGTGKTAAFALPVLMKIKYAQGQEPRALVLAPTRELVLQLADRFRRLARYTDLRVVPLYGGTGFKQQTEWLEGGADVVVATPGRLVDMYQRQVLVLKKLNTLIIDEADKMMDMGFMPQIRKILEIIPRKRQNLLFSATMSGRVEGLSAEFLAFPEKVEVAPPATPAATIDQRLYETPNLPTKLNLLTHLLADADTWQRVMVFTRTKSTADQITKYLGRKADGEVRVIHANKDQNTRLNAMNAFREGGVRLLIATDVAARGLDIRDVTQVVNFEVPVVYEDYVHRIGRTGRAEQAGEAVTFATPAEAYHISKIEQLIKNPIPRATIPSEVTIPETRFAEKQEQARAIDQQRRREDPTYQGAFHEKKRKANKPRPSVSKSKRRPSRRRR